MLTKEFNFFNLVSNKQGEILWEDVSPWVYILIILAVIFIIFLIILSIRAHRRAVSTGDLAMVGETAVAKTNINPEGKIFVKGEIWDGYSDVKIKKGDKVCIRSVEGMKVYVEPLNKKEKS